MNVIRSLTLLSVFVFATALNGRAQNKENQPSIDFGMARIYLGMTVEQAEQSLSGASRHLQFLPDKITAIVYRDGDADDEGQITFCGGRACYAQFQMPNTNSAEDLAQEIAGAIENMETKTCTISNFAAHGTGGSHSDSVFDCGSRRFIVMTTQTFGSNAHAVDLYIEIGRIVN